MKLGWNQSYKKNRKNPVFFILIFLWFFWKKSFSKNDGIKHDPNISKLHEECDERWICIVTQACFKDSSYPLWFIQNKIHIIERLHDMRDKSCPLKFWYRMPKKSSCYKNQKNIGKSKKMMEFYKRKYLYHSKWNKKSEYYSNWSKNYTM